MSNIENVSFDVNSQNSPITLETKIINIRTHKYIIYSMEFAIDNNNDKHCIKIWNINF